jgi:predicted dehydrogenase
MAKVALIGAGFIGSVHANAYKSIGGAQVVAVADVVEQKGKKLAEDLGATYYSDLAGVLKGEEVDIVDICAPTYMHIGMVKEAAHAGKHILCEKPLALSLKEADEMIAVVKKAGVKSMVGQVLRFWPEYIKAKEITESGELGKPYHAFCERLCISPTWTWQDWMLDAKLSGGSPVDLHIHDLDFLIWLFGKPRLVKAQGVYDEKRGSYIHMGTNIEFEGGQSALAEAGCGFSGDFPFTMVLRILFERGTIDWVFRAGKNIEQRGKEFALQVYRAEGGVETPDVEKADPYTLELKYFVECIDRGEEVTRASFEDGRRALELALASIQSAKSGKVVKIK